MCSTILLCLFTSKYDIKGSRLNYICVSRNKFSILICKSSAVAYAETFHGGGFIQRQKVVICIWCVLFVTSQNDVIVLFPNQRFGEVF